MYGVKSLQSISQSLQGQGQGESAFTWVLISCSPHLYSLSPSGQFCLKPFLHPYLPQSTAIYLPVYPCCLRYAIMLLMFASFLDPPFCAHVARSSAALLPSCPEWPFTFTHCMTTFLSTSACTSRRHTAITVTFFTCRACPGGLGAVLTTGIRPYARCHHFFI